MLRRNIFTKMLNRQGQSMVEVGLITPLILVALWIPADFGIAFLTAHLAQNAVREATRLGVSSKDPFDIAAATAIKTDALNRLPTYLGSPTVTVKYFATGAANCMSFVEVSASGTYNYTLYRLFRLFGGNPPVNTTIARATRMRYEFQPTSNSTACTSPTITAP